jgi:hypothetical protein
VARVNESVHLAVKAVWVLCDTRLDRRLDTAGSRVCSWPPCRDSGAEVRFAGLTGSPRLPGCPIEEQRAIAEHACEKYSGRIGRSAAAKALQAGAVDLAVRAHVRHVHTRYDKLLASGVAREDARARVAASVAKCLDTWQRDGS